MNGQAHAQAQTYVQAPTQSQLLAYDSIWAEYRRTRDPELRNQLVMTYLHIVKYAVQRIIPANGVFDYDDMISSGVFGLIDAIEKFDPARGVKFETYASVRVRGSIMDQIRNQDWVPRNIRARVKDIMRCYNEAGISCDDVSADEAVAQKLNISVSELHKILDQSHTFNIISLDEQILDLIGTDSDNEYDGISPEMQYEAKELKEILADAIEGLPEKEKMVMTLYYYEELTLKEIGKVLGISESRVCQIHSKAIMKLRMSLERLIIPA